MHLNSPCLASHMLLHDPIYKTDHFPYPPIYTAYPPPPPIVAHHPSTVCLRTSLIPLFSIQTLITPYTMAITKDSPAPRNLPSHPPASTHTIRTHNRNRDCPIYNGALLDLPFAIIDYLITFLQELTKLFKEAIPCLWNWTILYLMFVVARMFWRYEQNDWL